jgi:Spy/CpxP family protein refolding chaperone
MKRLASLALLVLLASAAAAQPWGGRPWQQLSPEERQRAWDNYQRYRELPEQRQRMLERRYRQFQAMPPQEQQRLRQNYDAYRGFDPGQRREFVEKYHRWKARPR